MATDASYQQLVDAQAASRQNLTDMATSYATQQTMAFTDWYNDAAVAAWALSLALVIQSIQRQMATLTDAYLAQLSSTMTGRPVAPVGAIDITDLRKGTTAPQVYRRVAEQYRYAVSTGADAKSATDKAVQRADILADTDVMLANQGQSRKFMIVRKVSGYRRIIHPERSKSGTCGLCAAASSTLYRREELMPLHGRCKCTVAPVINGVDPGKILNRQDLDALYNQAGGTGREALKSVRYTVHDNSEIGPVLTFQGQNFRGPTDLPQAA